MRFFLFLFCTSFSFAQSNSNVDFNYVLGKISVNLINQTVYGSVTYSFEVLHPIDTIKIDAKNMTFSNVKINNVSVKYNNSVSHLELFEGYKKGQNSLTFEYVASPKKAMYFISSNENIQIWTQGQGKYTSHWFPSFDDVNEKVVFNLDISFDSNFQVISNGVLNEKVDNSGISTWRYRMKKPMSSYLLMLAIGKFLYKKEVAASGIPLENYIENTSVSKLEPTFRYSKKIMDFLENEIGIKYPWEVYRQIPVRDFLYAGMENTSATLFSTDFVVDEIGFQDRNYVNVNAHELAHQWFGNLITATSGTHHWLQEGFATYYALLSEKEVFGVDYFNYKLHQTAKQIAEASTYDTIPLLHAKASSLTYYQKGAWTLHVLREEVGEEVFKKAIRNYLKKYSFSTVSTANFLEEVQKLTSFNLEQFKKQWLENPKFDSQKALSILTKNNSIRLLIQVQEMKKIPFKDKYQFFKDILTSNVFAPVKEEIIYQIQSVPFEEKEALLQLAMQTNAISVRQAIVATTNNIPENFKNEMATTLSDSSYITRELSLGIHWKNYPSEQKSLLENTKEWVGFNDKNLRILWLALALRTPDFEFDNKVVYYDELLDYSSSKFETSIRQNALDNLFFINPNDTNYLPNLINALVSHKWQFSKFAKEKIRILLDNNPHRTYLTELLNKLPESEAVQLKRLLDEKK